MGASNQKPQKSQRKRRQPLSNGKDGYIIHSFNTELESPGNSRRGEAMESKSIRWTVQ